MTRTKRTPENWLRRAQEIARLGNWDQDPHTGELWWSDQTYALFGLNPKTEKMDFDRFLGMVHPDDREMIVQRTEQALKSDATPYRVEYRITIPEQAEMVVYEEALIDRNDKGEPVRITGIIQDITERKKNETVLARHKESLEEEVRSRTEKLEKIIKFMTGRELRMAELKNEIRALRKQLADAGIEPAPKPEK